MEPHAPLLVGAAIGGGVLLGLVLTAVTVRLSAPAEVNSPSSRRPTALITFFSVMLCGCVSWQYGVSLLLWPRLLFGSALIVLAAVDVRDRRLPNLVTLPGIVLGLLFSLVTAPGWHASLLGVVIGGGVPWAIAELYYRLRRLEGLGMGDVKMLAMIGAFLGWQGVLLTLMTASIAGSVAGLIVIARGRGGLHHAMPFGAYLAGGAALIAFIAPLVLQWLQPAG